MKLKSMLYAAMLSFFSPDSTANGLSEPVSFSEGSGNAYRRDRAQGENDLINLCTSVCKEDLWLFVGNRWYDIGLGETRGTVSQDNQLVNDILSNTNGTVTEYHNHPHAWCPNSDGDFISLEPMSDTDIIAHVYLSKRVKESGNRRLISKVADEHGIWTYYVSDELRSRILNPDWQVLYNLNIIMSMNYGYINSVPRNELQGKLDAYLEHLRDNGIIASYRKMR